MANRLEEILNYDDNSRNQTLNKIDIIHIKATPNSLGAGNPSGRIQWRSKPIIFWFVSWKWKNTDSTITDIIVKEEHYQILVKHIESPSS